MTDPAFGQGIRAVQRGHEQATYTEHEPQVLGDYQVTGPGIVQMAFHALAALLSVALIGGGAWWGYNQIMRDVNGVPVVRALDGPIRVAPEAPGGKVADHEGLSVNRVQAVGSASAPEDRLALAPAPIDLADEDLPAGALRTKPEPRPERTLADLANGAEADDADLVAPAPLRAQPASLTAEIDDDDERTKALVVAARAVEGAEPLGNAASEVATESELDAEAGDGSLADIIDGLEDETGTSASVSDSARPRPQQRPASAGSVIGDGATVASTSGMPASAAVDADDTGTSAATQDAISQAVALALLGEPTTKVSATIDVAPGTRLVQLGAFDSAAEADANWQQVSQRFSGLMADKQKLVVEAITGGRTFWRLRVVGFEDLSDARRFCAALVAERTDCIPVVAR